MAHHYSLQGKTALVTGGGRGLGLEIARELVERGANVAIVARDPLEIERAITDLRDRSRHNRLLGASYDLTDTSEVTAMLRLVRGRLGPIDVLVNNAGMIQVGPLDSMTFYDFEEAMKLHCFVPLRMMLGVRDDMRERGGGRIANITSVGGLVAVPHLLPYSASKFALRGLSQGMHAELARDGIIVSTIAPGLMRTGSPRNATFKGDHEQEQSWFTLADSLPFLSMSARRAAKRIVVAIERGEAHLVLGLPAKLAALGEGLFPGAIAHAMTFANALLPQGKDRRARRGFESESSLSPSILTAATAFAAARNNE